MALHVLIDAFTDCEFFAAGQVQYLMDLCGTNDNGTKCYEMFLKASRLISTQRSCNIIARMCSCKSIREGVAEQGCCINAIHNFIPTLVNYRGYNPSEIYESCDVQLPERGCNNSPLEASGSPANSVFSRIFALTVITYMLGQLYP